MPSVLGLGGFGCLNPSAAGLSDRSGASSAAGSGFVSSLTAAGLVFCGGACGEDGCRNGVTSSGLIDFAAGENPLLSSWLGETMGTAFVRRHPRWGDPLCGVCQGSWCRYGLWRKREYGWRCTGPCGAGIPCQSYSWGPLSRSQRLCHSVRSSRCRIGSYPHRWSGCGPVHGGGYGLARWAWNCRPSHDSGSGYWFQYPGPLTKRVDCWCMCLSAA